MSLQFVFGNSGSGKSDYLYETVLKQAKKHPEQNFLVIVPEQFTMQTQRELVERQKNHAIMNVDVLSFARLAYRVFDELGKQDLVVLEETGKNLVLRKVAEQKKEELRVLGGNLNKMGYIGEVKSLISELTQYNITPDLLEDFLKQTSIGETLAMKMQDILTMYRGFEEYLEGRYITAEEVLALLCDVAEESAILAGSVIVFDEFTGFTPIQNRLMKRLLPIADKVMVAVTIDIREDFYHSRGVHELFSMSKKTVKVLQEMAMELHVEIEDAVILETGEHRRYKNASDLFFLEQNLFRMGKRRAGAMEEEPAHIQIACLKNPREELRYAAQRMTLLTKEEGYSYRDMAVVTGDVTQYANYVPEIFEQYDIPYFIDQKKNIMFHPFTECIRSILEIIERDFSYESVFRFLRCGLAENLLFCAEKRSGRIEEGETLENRLTQDDIDALENYVLAKGIRGSYKWKQKWTFVMPDDTLLDMARLNEVREALYTSLEPLFSSFRGKNQTVKQQTYELYTLIRDLRLEELLQKRENEYAQQNDSISQTKAKEYAQIYRIAMDLLDKVVALLGEEMISIREYSDILDAGFEAAKVGVIPSGNDKVIIGDMERTRLNHVKILFFVGVNDGIVPKAGNTGGILSQFEREKMTECRLELAPTARERVFIQKFYLYLNMTKPSDRLYLSYAKVNADGKAMRRSYLIGTLCAMFPELKIKEIDEQQSAEEILTPESAMQFYIEGLREEAWENVSLQERWLALASWYFGNETYQKRAERLLDAAYAIHSDMPIDRAVIKALYGDTLTNSVTRLERFASCAFAHYLTYGLLLQERALQEFASVDMGNIYHGVLEHFSKRVEESEYSWFDVPPAQQEMWISESMEEVLMQYKDTSVFENARNRYLLERMKQTIHRTVWALLTQLRKGKFTPSGFEVSFSRVNHLDAVNFTLGEEEKMKLLGRIDRIDTYETDDKIYVKIIDYKSGNTSFSLLNLYHGLQLQLVVYLNAAMEMVKNEHPQKETEPAGIFYYHISDPLVETDGTQSEEEIKHAVLEQLKLNGLVNSDSEVYRAMDTQIGASSSVIPVGIKSDGSLKAASKVASTQEFHVMREYVKEKIKKTGRDIFAGNVSVAPYQLDDRSGCDYCPYHTVCGFDVRIPGFSYRKLERFDDAAQILERMKGTEQ